MTPRRQLGAFAAICALTTLVNVLATKGGGAPAETEVRYDRADPFGPFLERMRHPDDPNERSKAKAQLLAQHQKLVDELLKMAAPLPGAKGQRWDEWGPSPRGAAIEALGQIGTWEAIPLFMRNIDYVEARTSHNFSHFGAHPCAHWLGPRAVPHAVEYLRTAEPRDVSDKAIELFAYTFGDMHDKCGGGFEESLGYVRRLTTCEACGPRHENFQRLLAAMEKWNDAGRLPADAPDALLLERETHALLSDLRSDDHLVRFRAKAELLERHQSIVRELLEIAAPVEGEEPHVYSTRKGEWGQGPRGLAIELLRDIGTADAIPLMLENVEYGEATVLGAFSWLEPYPCASALASLCARKNILDYLRTTEPSAVNDKAIELFSRILLGADPERFGGKEETLGFTERVVNLNPRSENLRRLHVEMTRQYKSGFPE